MRRLIALLAVPLLATVGTAYREALPGYRFSFPRDHFEHADFRTEWWYYTGNLWTANGRRFGFELVFFREGVRAGAGSSVSDNPSAWRVDDVYLANAALTDVDGQRFYSHERLNRAGPGIAGSSFAEQRIWNGNWSDTWSGERQTLRALTGDYSLELVCTPAKPFVIQGENGVSQKAAGAGRASHYVSFPLLTAAGTIQIGNEKLAVSGQAWMDHEWFTHQLQDDQVGWDWFSVQLDDKTELMLFELRRKDGTIDPFSSGTFVAKDGRAVHLARKDFALTPLEWWRSAKTGGRYPVAWRVSVPSLHVELECRAKMREQELTGSRGTRYWEGAVDYTGSRRGVGYLEMTGYDRPVKID